MDRVHVLAGHVVLEEARDQATPMPTSAEAPHVRVHPPNKKHFVTNPWERLARWEGDGRDTQPDTIPRLFLQRSVSHAKYHPMAAKLGARDGPWTRWTWADYAREVKAVAKAFMALGCAQHSSVNILGWNSPEWFEAALGGVMAGLLPAGIYITNGTEACEYVFNHSKATVVFVDSDAQLQKVKAVRAQCPHLKTVVHWGPDCPKDAGWIISWREFMALSSKVSDAELEQRMSAIYPDNACYLSYTSGTTGNPKAVMYSHDNILWSFKYIHKYNARTAGALTMDEREVSYMPLSHIAGNFQLFGAFCMPLEANSEVHFAFPDAMQGSLPDTLKEVRPTLFLGVPRVWEKFYIGLNQLLKTKPELKSNPTAVKAFLGLDKLRCATTGAAPIATEIMTFFDTIELPISEIYGMTENAAYSHLNYKGMRRIGSVGPALCDDGAGSKIAEGSGEICCWSRGVMMGYMYMPEKTADTFDEEGFLRTGDVGEEREGFTFITGRIKEMIITAGGENMAPVLLENQIKEQLPALSNVMMVGDRQRYLIALITIKLMPDGKGGFTDELDPMAAAVDPACKTFADTQSSQVWADHLAKGIETANSKAASRAQQTRRYCVLPGDFSPVGEAPELTPTMKLKRDIVQKKYMDAIKKTYGEDFMPFS